VHDLVGIDEHLLAVRLQWIADFHLRRIIVAIERPPHASTVDAMIRRMLRPETEDQNLKNQTTTARLTWQPRGYDPHLAKWLHRIRLPTLLAWGANDRLLPPAYASAWQRLIPDAQLVVLPDCGHLPHVEQGAAFVGALERFFDHMRVAA